MYNSISKCGATIVLLAGLVLTYADFSENAIAETDNRSIDLFKSRNYSEVIDHLTSISEPDFRPEQHYLLLKSYNKTGNYQQSMRQIEQLESKISKELHDIVLYEKLSLLQSTGDKENLLKAIAMPVNSISNPYLLNAIGDTLIADYQSFSDKQLLRQSLEELIPFAGLMDKGPDILRMYAATFGDGDPRIQEINVDIWVLEDEQRLSKSERAITNRIKAQVSAYSDQIGRHFENQRRYKNYSYMVNTIPEYLDLLEDKQSNQFAELRDLLFYALVKKRKFSYLIGVLDQKKERIRLGLSDFEALSIQFDLLVRKGDPTTSISVLNRMIKMAPETDIDLKYLALAEYYFQRNHFEQALYFYNRLRPNKNQQYDISDIKWKIWRTHFLMENQEEMAKIAEWASSFEFEDDEMGARFCYWGYKLNFYKEGSSKQCYEQYPLTYYGLHSRFTNSQEADQTSFNLPVNLIFSAVDEISSTQKQELDFLKLVYQLDEQDLADSIIRTKLNSNDSNLMLALAGLLLEAERYYMVQYIVESTLRSSLQNSISSRKILLPFFYPLAFDEEVSRLEDKQHVPKTLILSVMREESHFNPQVKSVAGAVGLMQLMPDTARFVGKTIGLRVKLDSLTEPAINLKLGSAYLKRLMKRYNGNIFYTLAAYNGGPTNVKRWIKKTKTDDIDDFVESITFAETQNYVRRVMRSYYIYRFMYDQL